MHIPVPSPPTSYIQVIIRDVLCLVLLMTLSKVAWKGKLCREGMFLLAFAGSGALGINGHK